MPPSASLKIGGRAWWPQRRRWQGEARPWSPNSTPSLSWTWFGLEELSLKMGDGQKFQNVENEENRFFAITSSKLVRN